jgi:hypothetical protein
MVSAARKIDESPAPAAEAMASFRFIGRDIDPVVISQYLKVEPSAVYPPQVGGQAARQRRPVNMWRLDSGIPATEPLVDHLAALITVLLPVQQNLHELAKATGWSPSFYCGYFFEGDQGGHIELPPHILGAIAALGATLDLRVYSDQEE